MSLAQNLTGISQDLSYSYSRSQAQEISSHSWDNDLYQCTGYANGTQNYTSTLCTPGDSSKLLHQHWSWLKTLLNPEVNALPMESPM